MNCTLVCISTDTYDVFCSNVATFQLAESKDLILGCQALFSDSLNKLRTLKRFYSNQDQLLEFELRRIYTWAGKIRLDPALCWFMFNVVKSMWWRGGDGKVALCLLWQSVIRCLNSVKKPQLAALTSRTGMKVKSSYSTNSIIQGQKLCVM